MLKTFGGRLRRGLAANQDETAELRTSPCKNQTSWEMKIFNPLQILHAVRRSGGMYNNALLKGRSTLVAMVTTVACWRPRASFSHKNVAKKIEIFISLSRAK